MKHFLDTLSRHQILLSSAVIASVLVGGATIHYKDYLKQTASVTAGSCLYQSEIDAEINDKTKFETDLLLAQSNITTITAQIKQTEIDLYNNKDATAKLQKQILTDSAISIQKKTIDTAYAALSKISKKDRLYNIKLSQYKTALATYNAIKAKNEERKQTLSTLLAKRTSLESLTTSLSLNLKEIEAKITKLTSDLEATKGAIASAKLCSPNEEGDTQDTEYVPPPSVNSFENCRDKVDNNLDGLVDCADPQCFGFDYCSKPEAEGCLDPDALNYNSAIIFNQNKNEVCEYLFESHIPGTVPLANAFSALKALIATDKGPNSVAGVIGIIKVTIRRTSAGHLTKTLSGHIAPETVSGEQPMGAIQMMPTLTFDDEWRLVSTPFRWADDEKAATIHLYIDSMGWGEGAAKMHIILQQMSDIGWQLHREYPR